jgi:hypothetical protein
VSRRWRTTRYGASLGVAVIGVACGATVPGTLGGTLATLLIGVGLVGVMSLIFYEVGLSEDRDRSRRRPHRPPPPERTERPAPPDGVSGRARRRLERRRLR